jgi:conjugal transfer pilus assembly protein TrbC
MNKTLKILFVYLSLSFLALPCYADNSGSKIILFVSFSMPEESLKEWISESQKLHVPIVIRGLVDNSFKETIRRISGLIKDNRGGIQIDPKAFKRFKIEKVPAVVVAKSNSCSPNQTCLENFDVVYGDVTAEYALEKISDQKDNVSDIATALLQRVREIHTNE